MAAESSLLPAVPLNSCFAKEDFLKEEYDVDKFVSECRRKSILENFKTDLEQYLKNLKYALIELINQDYADFVNLSTNLVGLEKALSNLSVPLCQLKEEVLDVRDDLNVNIKNIDDKLQERAEMRKKKSCLQRLLNIAKSLEKIEQLLKSSDAVEQSHSSEEPEHLIERVASEFNQLQFYVTQSQGHPLVEKIRSRIAAITSRLQQSLESSFHEGIVSGQVQSLTRCLRTYAIIDKIKDAEALFADIVVKPYMTEVISEQSLKVDPQGLKGVYKRVLQFIPSHCATLLDVTSGKILAVDPVSGPGEHQAGIKGYDFLVNSVWTEIIHGIDTRMSSIFAPGNPDIFHEKYMTTMDFVEKFEKYCGSRACVTRLRAHPMYNGFMSRWSLPVYFQIRFQEIAGKLELTLATPFSADTDISPFYTSAVSSLWFCIEICWDETFYIQSLCNRFWKLTLQLLSRHCSWLASITLEQTSDDKDESSTQADETHELPTVPTLSQYVQVMADTNLLLTKVPEFFQSKILPKIAKTGFEDTKILQDALLESLAQVKDHLPAIVQLVLSEISSECSQNLEQAKNIPRLYRRTNKEAPSKASAYVATIVRPLETFLQEHESLISSADRQGWAVDVLNVVTEKYTSIISDVLTSIKKTEDSLLRLKRQRAKPGSGSYNNISQSDSKTLSDDDKIRLQFFLDVEEFGKKIADVGVTSLESYQQLLVIVQNAQSSSAST